VVLVEIEVTALHGGRAVDPAILPSGRRLLSTAAARVELWAHHVAQS